MNTKDKLMEKIEDKVCEHCGFSINLQPPRQTNCNHAYYPEACDICKEKSKKQTDNLRTQIEEMCVNNSINPIESGNIVDDIIALLTSEVEKERERLLGAVDVFIKPFLFDEKDDMAWKKQRKALSDMGGGKI